jgi:hypothetical protein
MVSAWPPCVVRPCSPMRAASRRAVSSACMASPAVRLASPSALAHRASTLPSRTVRAAAASLTRASRRTRGWRGSNAIPSAIRAVGLLRTDRRKTRSSTSRSLMTDTSSASRLRRYRQRFSASWSRQSRTALYDRRIASSFSTRPGWDLARRSSRHRLVSPTSEANRTGQCSRMMAADPAASGCAAPRAVENAVSSSLRLFATAHWKSRRTTSSADGAAPARARRGSGPSPLRSAPA